MMRPAIVRVILFFASVMVGSSASAAGTRDGGGGVGVRCHASGTFELLDLHEARLRGVRLTREPQSEEEAVKLVTDLIAEHLWNPATIPMSEYKEKLASALVRPIFRGEPFENVMKRKKVPVEMTGTLPLSKDVGRAHIAPGCKLEQVAYFVDEPESLKIDRDRWQSLRWLDRSALVVHELAYWMERHEGLENFGTSRATQTSERARRFIADLFHESKIVPKYFGVPLQGTLRCGSDASFPESTYFWAYGREQMSLAFSTLYKRSSFYQTRVVLSGVSQKEFSDFFEGQFDVTAPVELVGQENAPTFFVRVSKVQRDYPRLEAWLKRDGQVFRMGEAQPFHCWQ